LVEGGGRLFVEGRRRLFHLTYITHRRLFVRRPFVRRLFARRRLFVEREAVC